VDAEYSSVKYLNEIFTRLLRTDFCPFIQCTDQLRYIHIRWQRIKRG